MAEKSSRKGLGSGLNAIFGAESYDDKSDVITVPISKVEPRKDQPRSEFNELALEELAESISNFGLIQPITVRKLSGGFYQIIAGERRWRASRMAGLNEVPVRVVEADDQRATELALVENLQREDLNPVEEAKGYKTLVEEYRLTQEQVALSVGRSRAAVANSMRLLGLPKEALDFLTAGLLSAGHARALLTIDDPQLIIKAAQLIIERGLSVRQSEALAAKIARDAKAVDLDEPKIKPLSVDYKAELENDLTKKLARGVKIQEGKRKGYVKLEFYGKEDMEALIEALYEIRTKKKGKETVENA